MALKYLCAANISDLELKT